MKRILLALAATALIGAAPKWTSTVTKSAMDGHVLGNPAAKVKLVEYLSYTCGHCAHFSQEASGVLKAKYVSTGKVSVEFRNAVRDQFDMTAALAARCGGPARFFGNAEAILANQPIWLAKAQSWVAANGGKMPSGPINVQLVSMSKVLGFDVLLAKRGIKPKQLNACLIDQVAQKAVVGMTKDAFQTRKIHGTPSFLLNDVMVEDVHDWGGLEPQLKAALGAN